MVSCAPVAQSHLNGVAQFKGGEIVSQVLCAFVCVDRSGVILTHWVLIDSRHLLLTVLQAGSPRSGH